MSKRPLDIEEILVKSKDPYTSKGIGFLSKKMREKVEEENSASNIKKKVSNNALTKLQKPNNSDNVDENSVRAAASTSKIRKKKFNFEWDEEEDISNKYEPLAIRSTERARFDLDFDSAKHWSEKKVEEMTDRDWKIFREDFNIIIKGDQEIALMRSWTESDIPSQLKHIITEELGYEVPTPIQRAAVPIGLRHRDILGIAETGSGKTLAYLIPLISYIINLDRAYLFHEHYQESNYNKPLGLIVVPTRELANQVTSVALSICAQLSLNVVSIIGGKSYEETIKSISNAVHIVVATPGRLIDSIERGLVGLSSAHFCVLDEADRMIEMGFQKDMSVIFDKLPKIAQFGDEGLTKVSPLNGRITMLFSATLSNEIQSITKEYLANQIEVFVGSPGNIVANIDQNFIFNSETKKSVDSNFRYHSLFNILKQKTRMPEYLIIIFANYRKTCDEIFEKVTDKGYKNVYLIHGSKSQESREQAIEEFRDQKKAILVATDVAARGIDISNISTVVNFQFPNKFEEYIHRIGRTGRAGSKGESFAILDYNDSAVFPDLKKYLLKGKKKCPVWLENYS